MKGNGMNGLKKRQKQNDPLERNAKFILAPTVYLVV